MYGTPIMCQESQSRPQQPGVQLQRLNLTIDKGSVAIFVCGIDGPEIAYP